MRPPILNPLFAALSALPGVGPKLEKLFARLLSREGEPPRVIDLLFHLPTGFVDRRDQPKLSEVRPDTGVPPPPPPSPSPSSATGRRRRTGRARPTTSILSTTPTR